MSRGTVIFFNNETGFGIIRDEGGNKVFVHYSEIQAEGFETLYEGQRVYFDRFEGERETFAVNIRPQ